MGSNGSVAKHYIRSVSDVLSCTGKMKKQILSQISDSVDDFIQKNPDADLEMIQTHFGTPQEIAASYVDEQNASTLLKKMRVNRRMLAIVAGVMAAILLIWIGFVVSQTIYSYKATNGYLEVTIE